jgi:hypothetical protein
VVVQGGHVPPGALGGSPAVSEGFWACLRRVAIAPTTASATAARAISTHPQVGRPPDPCELTGVAVAVVVVGVLVVVVVVVEEERLACAATTRAAAAAQKRARTDPRRGRDSLLAALRNHPLRIEPRAAPRQYRSHETRCGVSTRVAFGRPSRGVWSSPLRNPRHPYRQVATASAQRTRVSGLGYRPTVISKPRSRERPRRPVLLAARSGQPGPA